MKRNVPWVHVLAALIIVHIAVGAARIPTKVWGSRHQQIERYRAVGPIRFHLDNEHRRGATAVEAVVAQTPENAVVLWAGEWKGALEFAPGLIAPRILVHEPDCPPGQPSLFGRPIGVGRLPSGASGPLVLVGKGDNLELEVR